MHALRAFIAALADTPGGALFLLLVCGHVLADFPLQPERLAQAKEHWNRPLVVHGLIVLAVQLGVAWPFWCLDLVWGVALLAAFHTLTDHVRRRAQAGRSERALTAFMLDQCAHLGAILAFSWLLVDLGGEKVVTRLSDRDLAVYARLAVLVSGYAFSWKGGTAIVRKLLLRYPQVIPGDSAGTGAEYAMGRTIGVLERLLVVTLVILGQWSAIALVVIAKSVARFRELERQEFADYYLIGTLSSVLVAMLVGLAIRIVVQG